MFRYLALFLAVPIALVQADSPPPIPPSSVLVIYNPDFPDSRKLAETYAMGRSIPADHVVGMAMSQQEEISRDEYEKTIHRPLLDLLESKGWMKRGKDPAGNLVPTEMRIRVIACIRGVPSRIRHDGPVVAPGPGEQPFVHMNEAAVDSELALAAVDGLSADGPLTNPYYQKEGPFPTFMSPTFAVGRIDGPSTEVCERMIRDALEVEKTGLWGMSVVDLSKKFPEGDQWLQAIVKEHLSLGIPTLVDPFPDTLPVGFPLKDVALYYGWYDWHVSGPFLDPKFRFKKGAVAVHLHSFSAASLRDPNHNWCAPLLARGAAATVGNVYEPYLTLTHHLDILQDRLLKGYSLVEAAYMAAPALSWQNIVLGDPLYRPFLHLDDSGEKKDADHDYRVMRMAVVRWGADQKKMDVNLQQAVDSLHSGTLAEAMGLSEMDQGMDALAVQDFDKAKKLYTAKTDQLRLELLKASIERSAGKNSDAIKHLRDIKQRFADVPESAAATAWLTVLDPPAPPPAKPK